MKTNSTQRAGSPARNEAENGSGPPRRILVVDDERDMRRLHAEVLSCYGYQVDTAEDGAAAWNKLQLASYDLLITDHNMPKVTGLELVGKARAAGMALPVILMSGAMPLAELNRHPELQINATLEKPFIITEVLEKVENALRRHENMARRPASSQPVFAANRKPQRIAAAPPEHAPSKYSWAAGYPGLFTFYEKNKAN
jgi:DNA-binding response OmpR family regulator